MHKFLVSLYWFGLVLAWTVVCLYMEWPQPAGVLGAGVIVALLLPIWKQAIKRDKEEQ